MNDIANKKAFYDNERKKLWELIPLDTPLSVSIETSSICNLKCNYCAQILGKSFENHYFKREVMSWETFEVVANQLKKFPSIIKKVHLFRNGEPLLNPKICDMILFLKKNNIAENININSNGILLNKKLSLSLIESGLDTLCISLNGITTEQYRKTCNVGVNTDNLVEQLTFFYENRQNCQLYIKIIDIALNKNEEEKFYKMFSTIADRVYIETACEVYEDVDYTNIIKKKGVNRHGEIVQMPKLCQLLFYSLHILANGDINPCNSIKFPIEVKNIHDMSLTDYWNSDLRLAFLKLHAMGNRFENKLCNKCRRLEQELRTEDYLDEHMVYIQKKLM